MWEPPVAPLLKEDSQLPRSLKPGVLSCLSLNLHLGRNLIFCSDLQTCKNRIMIFWKERLSRFPGFSFFSFLFLKPGVYCELMSHC